MSILIMRIVALGLHLMKRRNWEIWFDINILLSFCFTADKDKIWLV